jgi:hypothetical protein
MREPHFTPPHKKTLNIEKNELPLIRTKEKKQKGRNSESIA